MNILAYDSKIVNSFIFEIKASALDFDDRYPAGLCIVALAGVSTAEDWLLSCYKSRTKITKYSLRANRSYNKEWSCRTLLSIAKRQGKQLLSKEDYKSCFGRDYNHSQKTKPKSETKPKNNFTTKKTNLSFAEAQQNYRRDILRGIHRTVADSIFLNIITQNNNDVKTAYQSSRTHQRQFDYEKYIEIFHNHARHISKEDFKRNSYLAKKSKCYVHLFNSVKIHDDKVLIKSESTSAIQVIDETAYISKDIFIDKHQGATGKKGGYAQVSAYTIADGDPIYIVEGISTAFPFVQAGYAVFWAIDAGNLRHATAEIRAKYPSSEIYIGADNDDSKAGINGAQKCGNVDVLLAPAVGEDWNDVWIKTGKNGFTYQLQHAKDNQPEPTKLDKFFYTRYLTNHVNVKSLVGKKTIIRSTQETGKTVLMLELVKNRLQAGDRIVITTSARALTSSFYTQLNKLLPNYHIGYYAHFNRTEDNLRILNLCDVIVTTTQSFTKVNLLSLRDYTFIIDEIESVVASFANNATHKVNLLANRDSCQQAIVESSTFLAIDADVTKVTKNFVSNAIKEQESTCAIDYCINTYKHKGRTANFYSANDLMLKVINSVLLGKQLVIGTTTKGRAKDIYFALNELVPTLNMLVVTGDDHDKEEVQELVATRDSLKYDIVIYNTAIGVGIDINKHFYDEVFIFADEVYGQTSNTVKQLMQRFRKIKTYNIAVSRRVRPEGEDPYYYLGYEIVDSADAVPFVKDITKLRINNDLQDSAHSETLREVTADIHSGLMSEVSLITQYHINECKFWTKNIKSTLERAGFKVVEHGEKATEQEVEYLKEFIEAGKEAKKQSINTEFNERLPLEYSARKSNKDDSIEVFKQCRKTDILIALKDIPEGEARDRLIYKLSKDNKKFSGIVSNISIISKSKLKFRDYSHEKRAKDPTFYMSSKGFINTKRKELNLIAEFAGFDPVTKKLVAKSWSTRNNSAEMLELLSKLGIDTENVIATINRLLFKIGLRVDNNQVRIPKAELTAEQLETGKKDRYREYFVVDTSIYENICNYVINTPEDKEELKNISDFMTEEVEKVKRYHINKTIDPPSTALIA